MVRKGEGGREREGGSRLPVVAWLMLWFFLTRTTCTHTHTVLGFALMQIHIQYYNSFVVVLFIHI